jgi:hypothetical protein
MIDPAQAARLPLQFGLPDPRNLLIGSDWKHK